MIRSGQVSAGSSWRIARSVLLYSRAGAKRDWISVLPYWVSSCSRDAPLRLVAAWLTAVLRFVWGSGMGSSCGLCTVGG
jgi:hypothetical protein